MKKKFGYDEKYYDDPWMVVLVLIWTIGIVMGAAGLHR